MPTLKEIEQFRLDQLAESERLGQFYILCALPILAAIFFFLNGMIWAMIILLVLGGGIAAIINSMRDSKKKEFATKFKRKVFQKFVHAIYPESTYRRNKKVNQSFFKASTLFNSFDSYSGEDYFSGTTENGHSFQFSELKVTSTTTDSEGNSSTTNVFDGIFFVLDAPFSLSEDECIKVLPDTAEKNLGKFGKLFQSKLGGLFSKSKMVYMEEHPEFEKDYVVYAKSKEAAFRILTPAMIGVIYNLKYKWKKTARIAFVGDKIYIGFPYHENLFEPDIKQSILQQQELQRLYHQIALCFTMLEDFSTLQPDDNFQPKNNNWDNSAYKHLIDNSSNNPFLL
jgi:hypothetical protein